MVGYPLIDFQMVFKQMLFKNKHTFDTIDYRFFFGALATRQELVVKLE
jgi:hypothetical protein